MYKAFLSVLLVLLAAPAARPAGQTAVRSADEEAIAAIVQSYFAALNQHQADAALKLWSQSSPEYLPVLRNLEQVLARRAPEWTGVWSSLLRISGDRAVARVQFLVSYTYSQVPPPPAQPNAPTAATPATPQAPPRSPPMLTRNVMEFVREAGTWRIMAEKPESQYVAERLLGARDDVEFKRVVAEDPAVVDLGAVRSLLGLSGLAAGQQRYDEAIRGFTRAVTLSETPVAPLTENERQFNVAEMQLAAALAGLAAAHAYKPKADPVKAIELYMRALALYEKTQMEGAIGDVLQGLATAYYSAGDYASALTHYERALPLAIKQQDHQGTGRAQLGIGNVQYLFGQYELARAAYQQALETYAAIGMLDDQPRALQGLGRVYAAVGDFDRARAKYQEALAMLEKLASQKSEQASVLLALGSLSFQQAQFAEAQTLDERALALAVPINDAFTQGRAHFALGIVLAVQNDFERAIERYTSAYDAFQRATSADSAGETLVARGFVRIEQRDLARALEDFTASLPLFERTRNREGLARANLGLAAAHGSAESDPKVAGRALEAALRARELSEQALALNLLWQAHFECGLAWLRTSETPKAQQAFEAAIRVLESARFEVGGDADAQTVTRRAAPYVALVESHLARNDVARALIAAEGAKRRLLEDLLQPFRFRLTRGLTPERQVEEQRSISRRVSLLKQLRRERDQAAPRAARLASLDRDLTAARAAAAEWNAAAARDVPSLVYLRGETAFTSIDQLAAALPPNTAAIHFIVGDHRTSVIVATPRQNPENARTSQSVPGLDVFGYTVPVTRQQLAEQVWRFTDGIEARAETVAADARALHALLLGPAAERIADRAALVIVPDDVLWTLPFEALMVGEQYLIERASVTLMPSFAAWTARPADPASRPLIALPATGEFSDISPLQARLAIAPEHQPAARTDAVASAGANAANANAASSNGGGTDARSDTLAVWELFERDLSADDLVMTDVRPKAERLRLDAGHLGPTGLFWAAQIAGARRVILSRRAPPAADVPTATTLPLPHPHDWATRLVIGPPQPPQPPQPPPQP